MDIKMFIIPKLHLKREPNPLEIFSHSTRLNSHMGKHFKYWYLSEFFLRESIFQANLIVRELYGRSQRQLN